MDDHEDCPWPPFAERYADAYGRIEPEVYEAAGRVWPKAKNFALANLRDAAAGRDLLMKAAANVSGVYSARPGEITDLHAYLYRAYYYLVLRELKQRRLHDELLAEAGGTWLAPTNDSVEELETRILIEQIMQAADSWTRQVFQLRVLGYSFEEIGPALHMSVGGARNKFRQNFNRLLKRFGGGENPGGHDSHR
jgi:DNA-directed RNA polymerase specialized sigma24 family protein